MVSSVRKLGILSLIMLLCLTIFAQVSVSVMATKGSYPGANGLIAFSRFDGSDEELYVMNSDGTGVTPLTSNTLHDNDPCWSPDGKWIAFVRPGSIWVIRADGTGSRQVSEPPDDYYDISPAWSPDGETIIFTRSPFSGLPDIYKIDAESTGTEIKLIENARDPSWSPDGSMIAYSNITSGIWVADSSTGLPLFSVTSAGYNPCWSPDGQRIVYDFANNIHVTYVYGNINQVVTTGFSDREPNWSPDGEKIIFERIGEGIWIIDSGGSDPHDLTPTMPKSMYPDWQTLPEPPVGGEVIPSTASTIGSWLIAGISTIALTVGIAYRKRKTI